MSEGRQFKRPNRRVVLAGALSSVAAISTFGVRAATPNVKVGAIMPSSGVLAFPGQACVRGINFGAVVAKERLGIDLTIIHADTQSRPENGRIAAESLIRQGCNVLIGAWDSGATISALQAAEAAKVPMVVHIATAPQITSQGFTQVFRYYPTANQVVRQGLTRMKEIAESTKEPPKGAVVIHLNNTFGTASAAAIRKEWKEVGLLFDVVAEIPYDEKARDLSVEVAKAKASGADTLVPITRVNDAVLIVREMVRQGWNPKMVLAPNGNGPIDKAFYDALGKYSDDYMGAAIWVNPKSPDAMKIVARFEKEHPNDWFEANTGCAFESVQIVADAVKRANSAESGAIHAALKATKLEPIAMTGGPIEFDENGQNKNVEAALIQGKGGRPVVVAPAKFAVSSPVYPMTPYEKR